MNGTSWRRRLIAQVGASVVAVLLPVGGNVQADMQSARRAHVTPGYKAQPGFQKRGALQRGGTVN